MSMGSSVFLNPTDLEMYGQIDFLKNIILCSVEERTYSFGTAESSFFAELSL